MDRRWLTVADAAEYSGCHPETVRDALRAGELQGIQRSKGATWKTTTAWIDAWITGEEMAA